ncbi:MAG: fructose 1,6-bisphosphatase [Methanotrichaceae archaeon]|nr:fructose 1,6-bisphosphatase [Methanotrichaceae archaeon]
MTKITVSLIKADVGGFPGHSSVHPALIETAESHLDLVKKAGALIDFRVMSCGDDLELLMSHKKGCDSGEIHAIAWECFEEATEVAKKLKLYGAGQDLLADAFSGNIRGLGPGVAEMEFTERTSEPFVAFMMDKTEPGAFNLPIFKIFADPFNSAGLVIDPACHSGFVFEIWDIMEHKKVFMKAPEELYDILALIGAKSRYVIKRVYPKTGSKLPEEEAVAVVSTEKLFQTAGTYVGKDDPVALVRSQSGLPALGEVLEPFGMSHLVSGWMRGSHNGPLMPCSFEDAHPTRFDGPPRVTAAGFQLAYGQFVGPADLFRDPAFDLARRRALEITEYMRGHGPFEPHRLPMEDMEYTTLPHVMKCLGDRFVDAE